MANETMVKEATREQAFTQVSAAPDGDVPAGHTLIVAKTDNKIYQKTGSTEVEIPNKTNAKKFIQAIIAQIDETNGGASGQTGFAYPNGESAQFDIVAGNELTHAWAPMENIVIDKIIYDVRSGQTQAFNAHQCVIQVEVEGALIEAGSHLVLSSAARTEKILNSGNGVAVSAEEEVTIAIIGDSLAVGDDIFGLRVTIEYHLA